MSKELKTFMFYKPIGWYIACGISAGLLIFGVISTLASSKANLFAFIAAAALLAVSILMIVLSYKRVKKFEADEVMCHHLDADFKVTIPFRKGHTRFGKNWIFVKGTGRALSYNDITQVYQYIHRTNFAEDGRALKYVDRNGKHRILCKLNLHGESDYELSQMVSIICAKNPMVKVGYR